MTSYEQASWQTSFHLVHVEDEIEFADILKALVEGLNEDLDQVQDAQLRLGAVHAKDEIQRCIMTID